MRRTTRRSSRIAAVLLASCVSLCAGCRPARDLSDPSRAAAHFDFVRDIGCHDHLELGVVDEPLIAGFRQYSEENGLDLPYDKNAYLANSCRSNYLAPNGPENSRVITLVQFSDGSPVGATIQHVDATAPIFGRYDAGSDRTTYFVPVVGPRGEQGSQAFRREGKGPRAPLRPIAPPIGRVRVLPPGPSEPKLDPGFAIYAAGSSDDGKQVVRPVSNEGTVAAPEGVVGAVPLGLKDGLWQGWMVRWKGAKGTGWSYSRDQTLADAGAGPVWKSWDDQSFPVADITVGHRFDGLCDAEVYRGRMSIGSSPGIGWGKDPKPCETAFQIRRDQVLARERRTEDRREADRAAEATREANEPTNLYPRLASDPRTMAEACKLAQTFSTSFHQSIVVARLAKGIVSDGELECAVKRDQTTTAGTALRAELKKRADAVAAAKADTGRETVQHSYPVSPGGAALPNNDAYNKAVHDYTYGSGKASTCPFADRSLCK